MAAPVSPCDSCGSPIPDSDLETGAAIILLSKRYCSGCKSEAMQSVSLDDLGPKGAPARAAAPPPRKPAPAAKAPSPPPKAAPPAPAKARAPEPSPAPKPAAEAKRPERKAAPARRPSTSAPAASRKPLVIAGIAVGIIVIVGVVFLLRGHPGPTDHGQPPTKGATGPATTTPEDREAQARDAFAKLQELAARGVSWDLILAAADKARSTCKGTAWEKKLEEIRTRAVQEKEAEEASREITPLLDELKGAVATDLEFKRYPELQTKFQIALETASKAGSVKRDEIRALQRDYNGRYEKLAEPHYAEINEAAVQLADERRFDDAIRKINTFPQHLRHSGAWLNLEKLKKDIERRKQK
jgi:hypothetical protein